MENTEQKSFSVSLVYTRNIGNHFETDLRVSHLLAVNEYEALGKTIKNLDEEMKGFVLTCKVVKEFKLKSE